ncbi:phosphatidate cytidylyltransferase [Alistipes communis]|nr:MULTISPECIES: phosphatidate cytidylyltransferase [Alistipes]MBD9349786.1 phosphatidate cytidylyltransferase [Alistipes communis]MBS5556439.1 phosphatidate cytidylyltransferase [Alistipes sp.]MCB6996824.1 phosphatidate cytidylyltransferase [Alistipes communis]HCH41721.1 phosphatidate cytidylyltransferase [Alistipes communis]HCP57848.1 phosphatidate cytidylyltransferase [Alistipes communis]
MKNLMVRTLSGLVLVAVFVGAVLGSQWSFGALLLLILVGGQTEFYKLARETGLSPQRWMGLAVGVLLFALNFIVFRQFSRSVTDEAGGAVLYLLLYIGLLLPTLFVCELFRRSATPLANLGATLLGVLYVAVPLSLLLYVPVLAGDGVWRPETVLCYIFIIWANDVFAYLVGMTFGRHRLCERLSPKKSWEGFFGGLAGAVATGLAAAYALDANYWVWGGLALVASLSGVAGDLVESMFKREAGVKDSGQVIPGHGGVLDRFDALLLSAPYVFLYLLLVGRFV